MRCSVAAAVFAEIPSKGRAPTDSGLRAGQEIVQCIMSHVANCKENILPAPRMCTGQAFGAVEHQQVLIKQLPPGLFFLLRSRSTNFSSEISKADCESESNALSSTIGSASEGTLRRKTYAHRKRRAHRQKRSLSFLAQSNIFVTCSLHVSKDVVRNAHCRYTQQETCSDSCIHMRFLLVNCPELAMDNFAFLRAGLSKTCKT